LKNYNPSNFEKKIILLLIDTFIIFISVNFAFTLRLEKFYPFWEINIFVYIIIFSIFFTVSYLNNIYRILLRYFNYHSIKQIVISIIYFQIFLILINLLVYEKIYFPRSVSFIAPILICIFIILSRLIISFIINIKFTNNNNNNIMIIGINNQTVKLVNNLRQNLDYGSVKCLLDDSEKFKKRELNGVKIYKVSNLYNLLEKFNITEIIIGSKNFSKEKKITLFNKLKNKNIRIKNVDLKRFHNNIIEKYLEIKPSLFEVINRPKIKVNEKIFSEQIRNKNILVTGGAGSIGSELTSEILNHKPKKLYVIDISELNLFNLIKRLKNEKKYNRKNLSIILGDCGDLNFLFNIFKNIKINEIYHAAAYKHVEFGEENPYSMIKNNVFGTKNLIDFSVKKNIKNFTFISSDKAVNPKSILGYSKKIGEKLIQNIKFSKFQKNINFTIIRFGNVIGSSGSVIPIFLNQIKKKQSLTVTNKKVKRYFMSISEAVQLIINASYYNTKGIKIFALDMGKQLNIYDLAKRLINLSGYTLKGKSNPKGDIKIKIVGLKKGEKLSEELVLGNNLKETKHPKIMLCDEEINKENLNYKLLRLKNMLDKKINIKTINKILK
jgi:FlaA1/EpsC-like NDP-sugar epimerase